MNPRRQALAVLAQLGLSELESEVYAYLLAHPPATAYRIAKAIGKATANTYKAIDSLAQRGAVLVEQGGSRMCRAVPASEFLRSLERAFSHQIQQADAALSRLEPAASEEGAFRLESASQVLDRCRQMLENRAEKMAVIDAFPAALDAIRQGVARAVERGVEVTVRLYNPADWGAQRLNVAIDGREAAIALLSDDLTEVVQAVWTNSLYLACLLQGGMLAEQTIQHLRAVQDARDAGHRMRQILERHESLNTGIPGQKELLARFSPGDSDGLAP